MIGARAIFCAGHKLPQHESVHGHSYEVWAYVESGCVEELQDRLREVCADLDHTMLNDILPEPTMECIARHVGAMITDAVRVVVNRPIEGMCCEWART